MESFGRISPKDKNITPKDSRISPKDKKISPKDSGISPKDKLRSFGSQSTTHFRKEMQGSLIQKDQ